MLTAEQATKIRKGFRRKGERLPLVFGALSDPRRFQIFRLLLRRCNICVTDVAAVFGISVSAASQQLRILERTGLVRRERHGQMTCYEIKGDDPIVKSFIRIFLKGRKKR